MKIIARKPRHPAGLGTLAAEWIVVDISDVNPHHRFVVGTATALTLKRDQWLHGTYHRTQAEALADFNARPSRDAHA